MTIRKRAFLHDTTVMQKHAVNAEELADFREGDRVMTVDGFPGRVTGVLFGPYQGSESYQVELENGMGGGDYNSGQLSSIDQQVTASLVEAMDVTSAIPVEAVTDHSATLDYPELGDILEKRLPNENIQIFAARRPKPKYIMGDGGPEPHPDYEYALDRDECVCNYGKHPDDNDYNQIEPDCPVHGHLHTSARTAARNSRVDRWISNNGPELYKKEYSKGWTRSRSVGSMPETNISDAYEDGYMDHATGMERWHTVHCDDPGFHEKCPEALSFNKTARNKDDEASFPDIAADDPAENLSENENDPEEAVNPDKDADEDDGNSLPGEEEEGEEGNAAQLGDVTPPSSCSYCGNASFSDPQMTGRGVRVRCDQCGGTMKSWGGQWEPEFPNSSQNNASEQGDYRSGGVGGKGQAPSLSPLDPGNDPNASGVQGPNQDEEGSEDEEEGGKKIEIKVSRQILGSFTRRQLAESLQSKAGIVQHLFNRLYQKARAAEAQQVEWWMPPARDLGTNLQGPAQYNANLPEFHKVTLGSVSDYDDPEWRWHFTSSWIDVQAKARRIRKENHVKIVAASRTYVSAEVQGDTNVYETQLNYVPGTRKVADWACGCKWGSYTWGRSPRFRRFEGRLCSHALATQYEANSRGMFGRDVQPNTERPEWQKAHHPVVVQYDKSKEKNLTRRAVPPANMKRTFSSLVLDSDGVFPEPQLIDLSHPPVYASVQTMVDNGTNLVDVIEMVASFNVPVEDARSMVFDALLSDGIPQSLPEVGEGAESGSAWTTEASKQHKHHPTTRQEHGVTYWPWMMGGLWGTCGGCGGSGCTNCNGTGQVAQTDPSAVGDGGVAAGGDAGGATTAKLVTADYSTADPLVGLDAGHNLRPTVLHSNSDNPASTGWATGQDPQDWGNSLITNDFGVTYDASLHTASEPIDPANPFQSDQYQQSSPHDGTPGGRPDGHELGGAATPANELEDLAVEAKGRHSPPNPNDVMFSYEVGRKHGFDWVQKAPKHADFGTAANQAAEYHEYQNPGMKFHYLEGFNDGAELSRNTPRPKPKYFSASLEMSEAATDHLSRMLDANLHDEPEPALPSTDGELGDGEDDEKDVSKIIAAFHRTAGGQALKKEAMKDFSFTEQQDLINEGKGSRARNFDDLKIAGTHYELIGDDDGGDETILWV
jgi:hypothetical protein